jgi:hypothetical protein
MAFTKLMSTESVAVLTDEDAARINNAISKLGKSSAAELSDDEREVTLQSK